MADTKKFEPGGDAREFTLADYRRLVEGVRGLVKPPVNAPLEWAGDSLDLARVEGFYAKLSGSANPYSMMEQSGKAGGLWGKRVRDCSNCAYEVNAVPGLDGKVLWLEPGAPGEYVGQWVADGSYSHGPPACSLTIRLLMCGEPVEGATVTIFDFPAISTPPRAPVTGTTDSAGSYTFPPSIPSGIGTRNAFTIAYDGITSFPFFGIATSVYFCDHTLDFCYDKAIIHADLTLSADPEVTLDGSVASDSPVMGAFVRTRSGSVDTFKYQLIRYCSTPSHFPRTIGVESNQAIPFGTIPESTHHTNTCVDLPIDCGDEATVDVTQYDFSSCWFFPLFGGIGPRNELPYSDIAGFCGNVTCASGNKGPYYRGLAPKTIEIRLATVPHRVTYGPGDSPLLFADDEDQWITCFLAYTTDRFGFRNGFYYDSGCRGGSGNYQGTRPGGASTGPFLNQSSGPGSVPIFYRSTRVVVLSDLSFGYTRYPAVSCADGTGRGPACWNGLGPDGLLAARCVTAGGTASGLVAACSPLDASGSFVDPLGDVQFTYEIRETC